jgi:uncharacterized protein (DUF1697 family)
MPRYVAFLRAVNLGGASTIEMDVLRHVFEGLGFSNVGSFIASGNIIFESPLRSTARLEGQIEAGLLQSLRKDLTPFVRSTRELARIVAFDAFPKSTRKVRDQLAVVFLSSPPSAGATKLLELPHAGSDEFRVRGREVYWLRHVNPDGTVYSTMPLDRVLAEPFTIRSMRTLAKLAQKYC